MASGAGKSAAFIFLLINTLLYFIVIIIAGWSVNHAMEKTHETGMSWLSTERYRIYCLIMRFDSHLCCCSFCPYSPGSNISYFFPIWEHGNWISSHIFTHSCSRRLCHLIVRNEQCYAMGYSQLACSCCFIPGYLDFNTTSNGVRISFMNFDLYWSCIDMAFLICLLIIYRRLACKEINIGWVDSNLVG